MATFLLWCDLETTGLSATQDELLEAAFILTDADLNEIGSVHGVLEPGPFGIKRLMGTPVVRKMHTNNGLIMDALRGETKTVLNIQNEVINLLDAYTVEGDVIHLAGSGVAAFDRVILTEYMSPLMQRLHYAPIDIGVLRRTWRMWTGRDITEDNAAKNHRAMDDVRGHLHEARAFRDAFGGLVSQ